MRLPRLPAPGARVTASKRGRLVLAEVAVAGRFVLDGGVAVRNKFTRNAGYVLDGLLRLANVTLYDEGGTGRTASTGNGGLLTSHTASSNMGQPVFLQFGTGTTSPTVTDNNLVAADIAVPTQYVDTVETSSETRLVIAGRWAPDAGKSYAEAGLKWIFDASYNYAALLARTVFPSYQTRSAYTEYLDGYVLSFPASFTVWFVRALHAALSGHDARQTRGRAAVDVTGASFAMRAPRVFAGSPDVMIGSDNSPASPTDYNLKAPVASLGSQSQIVEVDTTLQEVRVVRTGTYTPSANVTLGEIGLFCSLNGFAGGSAVTRKVMLVRVPLDTPVTLSAGTTYTLGIVIRLA
jgi:hypothetical protein